MNGKKRYCVVLSILAFLSSVLALVLPLVTAKLVDVAIEVAAQTTKDFRELTIVSIVSISVILLLIAIKFTEGILNAKFIVKNEKIMKEQLYDRLFDKELNELNNYKTAEVEQLFVQDIQNIIRRDIDTIPMIIKQFTRVVLAIVFLLLIDYKFLLVVLVCGILGFVLAKLYYKFIKPRQHKVMETEGIANSFLVESKEQAKLIKAYEAKEYAFNYYKELNDSNIKEKRKRNYVLSFANSGIFAFSNILYIFAVCYGAYSIANSVLTYGSMIALIQLLSNVQNPFLNLSPLLNQLNMAKVSIERINKALQLNESDIKTNIKDFDKIVFDNVSFSYDKVVFENLSFEINKGECVLLQGPSGIGKTTIFMLLLGFIKPTNGTIYIVKDNESYEINSGTRSLFSYVPQENILFSGTILDNIYILTGKKNDEIVNALKIANIYDEIAKMPKGLNTNLKERGQGLSLGQIQRVLIAIAILKDNPILLLDEFSSALDSENERIILNNIIGTNKTIVYITHKSNNFPNHKTINVK